MWGSRNCRAARPRTGQFPVVSGPVLPIPRICVTPNIYDGNLFKTMIQINAIRALSPRPLAAPGAAGARLPQIAIVRDPPEAHSVRDGGAGRRTVETAPRGPQIQPS
jgi:hypothetical protein